MHLGGRSQWVGLVEVRGFPLRGYFIPGREDTGARCLGKLLCRRRRRRVTWARQDMGFGVARTSYFAHVILSSDR